MGSAAGVPFVLMVDDQAAVRDLLARTRHCCDGVDALGRLRLRVPDAVPVVLIGGGEGVRAVERWRLVAMNS